VKPAASSDLQPESRAGLLTAKATSHAPWSGGVRVWGLGGVRGAARVHGDGRNTRGPSAQPGSGRRGSYKPMVNASAAQRESEGVVLPWIAATNNAAGGKGPCFGRARDEGTCQGMAGRTGPNHPIKPPLDVNALQPPTVLGAEAKRRAGLRERIDPIPRCDARGTVRLAWSVSAVHASSRRSSASRVREIRTHGLKGGASGFRCGVAGGIC
jgi:hypothetical protein